VSSTRWCGAPIDGASRVCRMHRAQCVEHATPTEHGHRLIYVPGLRAVAPRGEAYEGRHCGLCGLPEPECKRPCQGRRPSSVEELADWRARGVWPSP